MNRSHRGLGRLHFKVGPRTTSQCCCTTTWTGSYAYDPDYLAVLSLGLAPFKLFGRVGGLELQKCWVLGGAPATLDLKFIQCSSLFLLRLCTLSWRGSAYNEEDTGRAPAGCGNAFLSSPRPHLCSVAHTLPFSAEKVRILSFPNV